MKLLKQELGLPKPIGLLKTIATPVTNLRLVDVKRDLMLEANDIILVRFLLKLMRCSGNKIYLIFLFLAIISINLTHKSNLEPERCKPPWMLNQDVGPQDKLYPIDLAGWCISLLSLSPSLSIYLVYDLSLSVSLN